MALLITHRATIIFRRPSSHNCAARAKVSGARQVLLQSLCTSRLGELAVESKQFSCSERSGLVKRQIIRKISRTRLEVVQRGLNFHGSVQVNGWLLGKGGKGLMNLVAAPADRFQDPSQFHQHGYRHKNIPGVLNGATGKRGLLRIIVKDGPNQDIGIHSDHRSDRSFTAAWMAALTSTGLVGRGTPAAMLHRSGQVFLLMARTRSSPPINSKLSWVPALKPSASRMARGIVTCPLLVRVDFGITAHLFLVTLTFSLFSLPAQGRKGAAMGMAFRIRGAGPDPWPGAARAAWPGAGWPGR